MIFTICNQKGGSGKSTTAGAMLSGATLRGRRALGIDLDPQANLTFSTGGNSRKPGAWELITGKAKPAEVIQHTKQGDIIPAGPMLATADTHLLKSERYKGLERVLRDVSGEYDIIIIDTPAGTGTLLLNALTASDRYIIPTGASLYALQGLISLVDFIRQTQQAYNPDLFPGGLLFTMYNARTNSTRIYTDTITAQAAKWKIPVYSTRIRRGVAIEEAQTARESIFTYAPNSNPAKDYFSFLGELGI